MSCRKTRVNPLIVVLQKGLYTAAKRDYVRQKSLDSDLAMISVSPVSPGSFSWWERRVSSSSDWSSSFTSWTRPLGRTSGSSCQQRTSILDMEEEREEREGREGRSLVRMECRRRDSSADTSRDIDDIEDLELDGEEDICDSGEADHQEDTERLSGTVSSPDSTGSSATKLMSTI